MSFINDDFLLTTKTAKELYHESAENLPIIDYHCHINPSEIAEDKKFNSITELWLDHDHYKWRLMRSNAANEKNVTGGSDDFSKFKEFARSLSLSIGNPLYHWTHLELKRYFDCDEILNEDTAREIYDFCNKKIKDNNITALSLINKSNVRFIGTTDNPESSLEYHKKIKTENILPDCVVAPSFRPDKVLNIEKESFADYIANEFSKSAGIKINTFTDLVSALIDRLDYFVSIGARASDHGLDRMIFSPCSEFETDMIFRSVLNGKQITKEESDKYKTSLLRILAHEYKKRDIVMQLHFGVHRNPNSKMLGLLGPDSGYDCIRSCVNSDAVISLFDSLEKEDILPKTIIYSLNPSENDMLASVAGSFQNSSIPCKIQLGAAWWFNDTKRGIESQLSSFANLSVLGNFVGMLTDSRSFLSYTRHEYFRRILCSLIGNWVEGGEYPNDKKMLKTIVENICYYNAERFFRLKND